MDISDKLIVSYLKASKEQTITINSDLNMQVIFNFNEHEKITLKHIGNNYQIRIECYSYCVNGEVKETNGTLLIGNKTEYIIADSDIKELGYNPDIYQISFIKQNQTINSYFIVSTNKNVSQFSLNKIKEELEELKPGIIYDYFRQGKKEVYFTDDKAIISLINNWYKIRTPLLTQKVEDIKTTYVYEYRASKSNYKSIVKELIKPTFKNLNVKKTTSINSNRSIYADKIIDELTKYEDKLVKRLNIVNEYLKSIDLEIEDSATHDMYVAHINEQKSKKKEALDYEKEIKLIQERLNKTRLIKNFFINNLRIDDVELASIYHLISNKSSIKLSSKSSSKLFELYGFIILKKVIESLGFVGTNLNEFKNTQIINGGTTLLFTRNEYKIKVIYEASLKHYIDAEADNLSCVATRHNKPDYVVLFYKNDIFISSIIIEIKYRNSYYLFNDKYDQTVENTDNYAILVYKDKNNNIIRNAVERVYLINPDINETVLNKGVATTYLGYNLEIDFKDSKCFKFLKSTFNDILKTK